MVIRSNLRYLRAVSALLRLVLPRHRVNLVAGLQIRMTCRRGGLLQVIEAHTCILLLATFYPICHAQQRVNLAVLEGQSRLLHTLPAGYFQNQILVYTCNLSMSAYQPAIGQPSLGVPPGLVSACKKQVDCNQCPAGGPPCCRGMHRVHCSSIL